MADYKKMYFELFNKITDVIEDLQEIQQKTEEMYMNSEDMVIELIRENTNTKEQ